MTSVVPPEIAGLLPSHDEAPRCAEYTRSLDIAPQGTALDVALLVLVETPLPWPKPVFAHALLDGMDDIFDSAMGRARILATVPRGTRQAIVVTCFWRDGAGATHGAVLTPADRVELHECVESLHHEPPTASRFLVDGAAPRQAVIVCTQGSHDICCGTEGTRLAAQLEIDRPDLALYRVSHTGGHRFAPSVMTLPDGRMWAHPAAADIVDIVDRRVSPGQLAPRCRGWWGTPSGPAQAAEVAAFATQPWSWDARSRTVTDVGDNRYVVETEDQAITVEVTVERSVPTIACRTAGGLPVKLATEFATRIVDDRLRAPDRD